MNRSRRTAGLSLGAVLLVSAILSVLAVGLCRLGMMHLWLVARSNSNLEASSLANSAASAAMARLLESREFGTADPANANIILETAKGRAVVTFSGDRAGIEGVPVSTNNLDGTVPVEGAFGRSVEAKTAHVVATAISGGSRRTVEAVLRLPPFPWAIVAGGTLETKERVLVGSLPDGVWPPPPDQELLPADLLANSRDRRALVLGGESTIMGDVESPGEIVLDSDAVTVKGEVRSGVAPVDIPQLHAADYDPATMGLDFDDLADPVDAGSVLPLNGAVRRSGGLEVSGLELNGAHLYVEGDLKVRGAVTGTGVLICTGDIDIEDVALQGATELAIVAEGNVNLRGRSQSGSLVRGIFYAGESFSARDITLAGVLIAGRATSGIKLENARVLGQDVPRLSTTTTTGTLEPATYRVGGIPNGRGGGRVIVTPDFSNVSEPSPLGAAFQPLLLVRITPTNGGFPVTLSFSAPSSPGFSLGDQTLGSASDLNSMLGELQAALQVGFPSNLISVTQLEMLEQVFIVGLDDVLEGGGGGGGSENLAITISGDLSRFLPYEDRVRVTSWFER